MTRRHRLRLLLPAAILMTVGFGSALGLIIGSGANAGASGKATASSSTYTPGKGAGTQATTNAGATHLENTKPAVTPDTTACTQDADKIGYIAPPTSGSPQNSTPTYTKCVDGQITQYGNSNIIYTKPTSKDITAGERLFQEHCSSCHMPTAGGGALAPNLRGVGPATVDFWVTTGRMPAATSTQIQADIKTPVLDDQQAYDVAAWINSLTPSAPYIPTVNLKDADLATGAVLFSLNCAACHTITGNGDALAFGTYAPSLHHVTAQQVAEAIRTGPGNMPRFTGSLSDKQVRDVVAYVTEKIQHPTNIGGFGLGGIGPVTEGFVALLFGVGGLLLVCYWIGDRA